MAAVACRQYQAFMLALSLLFAFFEHLDLNVYVRKKKKNPNQIIKIVLICCVFCGSTWRPQIGQFLYISYHAAPKNF